MRLKKPKESLKTAVLVPAYKRPEYTAQCIRGLEIAQLYNKGVKFFLIDDGSKDGTDEIFKNANLNGEVIVHSENIGLRKTLIEFIEKARDFDVMGVIGNDCVVPKNWLNSILDVFCSYDVDILSPNVYPSNAAYKYGKVVEGLPYMPASIVGGLWYMPVDLVEGIDFEAHNIKGIKGAFNILKQIVIEKDPKIGWLPDVVVQDIGHWSGTHPGHIKSKAHSDYCQEVGRNIQWG